MVEREFLTLAVWDRLDAVTAEHVGRAVAAGLGGGWRFDRVEWRENPLWRRHAAFFAHGDDSYVLVPGGPARLGWDRADRAGIPDEWVEQAAADLAMAYGEEPFDVWAELDEKLSPAREVVLGPVLMEVAARRVGEPPDGFRRPTADEWEYAYAGGGGVRFADWLAHAMKTPWPVHTLPNPFGLDFIEDERGSGYRLQIEMCHEPGEYRGGDGGAHECSGVEGLAIAMTCAPQYRIHLPGDPRQLFGEDCLHRRVFPLPAELLG